MIFSRPGTLVFLCLFSAFSLAASGQLKIVENSKEAAKCLKNCIFASTGASLPIQEESKGVKTQPGIYIGGTVRASAEGIDTANFPEHIN